MKCQDCVHQTPLVVQGLKAHLPVQGTQVQSLVWEDSTCCEATKPISHNTEPELYELQLLSARAWSLGSATSEATVMRSHALRLESSPQLPQLEKAYLQYRRSSTAKNQMII